MLSDNPVYNDNPALGTGLVQAIQQKPVSFCKYLQPSTFIHLFEDVCGRGGPDLRKFPLWMESSIILGFLNPNPVQEQMQNSLGTDIRITAHL